MPDHLDRDAAGVEDDDGGESSMPPLMPRFTKSAAVGAHLSPRCTVTDSFTAVITLTATDAIAISRNSFFDIVAVPQRMGRLDDDGPSVTGFAESRAEEVTGRDDGPLDDTGDGELAATGTLRRADGASIGASAAAGGSGVAGSWQYILSLWF